MSYHVSFNLDELSAIRFQELCNVLLQNYFSQLFTPLVRPGKDGGVDGKLEALPINYSDLLNKPFEYKDPSGRDIFWVLQCKFTQMGGENDREKAVANALKSEIKEWKRRKKNPTHFIFCTNVNLRKTALENAEKIGKNAFPYFEIWHEPKISGFIANSVALQKTFFPTRSTSLDLGSALKELLSQANSTASQSQIALPPQNTTTQSSQTNIQKSEPREAIQKLANYEISFLEVNNTFLEKLKVTNESKELPNDWKKYVHKSPCGGLLGLATDTEPLQWLIDKIAKNEAYVVFWNTFLGEKTAVGDDIVTLAYNPQIENELFSRLNKIFECVQGENDAHLEVDEYLRTLESKIIGDIKENRIQSAQESISALVRARKDYSSFKSSHPNAFYPNTRRWGRKPVFGWDFMDLWERVLKGICEIAFSDKYPKSVYDLLIYFPFHLCIEAIRNKLPKESFQAELFTLRIIFWVIEERKEQSFMDSFLENLDDLAEEVHNLDHRINDLTEAEWALSISKEVASYIADLGYLAISGKANLPIDKLENLLYLSTSLQFMDLLSGNIAQEGNWLKFHDAQQEFARKTTLLRKEFIFAWATFSWHQERNQNEQNPAFAISLLSKLEMNEITLFYSRRRASENGWLDAWFRPEGKNVSWSWSMDHDVRDSLQLAILTIPIKKEDFFNLDLFEVRSSYEVFVKELSDLREKLSAKGIQTATIETVKLVLDQAFLYHEEKLKDLIRNQKNFSEQKISEVTISFQKSLEKHNQEGALYTIEETLRSRGLEPTHFVGQYFITDKVWYLEDTGTSSYSVTGLGSGWAENVISGRAHLLIEKGREISPRTTYKKIELQKTLEHIRDTHDDEWILLASPMTLPWKLTSELVKNEHEIAVSGEAKQPGRSGRLGKVDLYYNRFLKRGELLLMPRVGFTWVIKEKIQFPKITTIEDGSQEAVQLKEKDPSLDLGLKALVYAREEGIMFFKEGKKNPTIYIPDPTEVETEE